MLPIETNTKIFGFGYIDLATSFGLKIGIPAAGLALLFLLVSSATGKLETLASMQPAERAEMIRAIGLAGRVMIYGCGLVVLCLLVRLSTEEVLGQALGVIGAALLFGSPPFFVSLLGVQRMGGPEPAKTIVDAFRTAGWICFLPGLVLVLRDAILRIWTGLSVHRVIDGRGEKDEQRPKAVGFGRIYSKCWHMDLCRSFVRTVCPAFKAKKPCWRVKVGCYCDERLILQAKMSKQEQTESMRGTMPGSGIKDSAGARLSARVKRQRCRQCQIYAYHQQQKYLLLSPMVFPGVGIVLYAFYEHISAGLWFVLQRTDQVMSFLAHRTGTAVESFAESGPLLTTLAFVWLTIIVLSYALRLLEYLVFDLQI